MYLLRFSFGCHINCVEYLELLLLRVIVSGIDLYELMLVMGHLRIILIGFNKFHKGASSHNLVLKMIVICSYSPGVLNLLCVMHPFLLPKFVLI